MNYRPRTEDARFLLEAVLDAPRQLAALPPFADVDTELQGQVLEQAATFVADIVAPLQRTGDEVGCRLEGGTVRTRW